MRNILVLGGLVIIAVLIVAAGGPLAGTHVAARASSQVSSVYTVYYDENGNMEFTDEDLTPSDIFSIHPYDYTPDEYGYWNNGYNYNDTYYYDEPVQPWYVQAFPGIGMAAQPIIQSIAPAPTPVYARPTCSITASPSTIPYGGSTVLRWSSQGATWADLTGLGTVDPRGSWQFDSLTRSRTFILSVSGPGGSGSCSTTVTVSPR